MLGPNGTWVLTRIIAIAAGQLHNAALDSSGYVWTWGWNYFGALGNGAYPPLDGPDSLTNTVPTKIPNGFTSVKAIASGGYHNLALKTNGTVWAWGLNDKGQLGDNSTADRHSPVEITTNLTGHGGVSELVVGGDISAALMVDHTLLMWGRNWKGEMGNGLKDTNDVGQWVPGPVSQASGLTNVQAVALGWSHVVALASDGTVWTWGQNSRGELGLGGTSSKGTNMPTPVPALSNVTHVSAGEGFSAALRSDGTVWTWGYNGSGSGGAWGAGELGDGTTNDSYSPVQVVGLTNAVFIRARSWKTLALAADGTAWSWGWNQYGELGDGTSNTNRLSPVRVCWPIIRTTNIGYGGVVSPSGTTVVAWWSTNLFISAQKGWYYRAAVVVDGTNVGVPRYYTFTNVVTDHTLAATFSPSLATNNTPMWWLYQANTNWHTNFNAAALGDYYQDGALTWEEYIAGTHPTNPESVFKLDITSTDGLTVLSFPTIAPTPQYEVQERQYTIEAGTNLLPNFGWQEIPDWIHIPGLGQTVVYTNGNSSSGGVFRVKVNLST